MSSKRRRWWVVLLGIAVLVVTAGVFAAKSSQIELAGVSAPPSTSAKTLFQDITVFDGERRLEHQDVLVSESLISKVAPSGEIDAAGAEIVDGKGLTVLPGLVDSHVHFMSAGEKGGMPPTPEAIAEAFLYSGVTTVLVAAGGDEVVSLREQRASGEALSPHLYFAGPSIASPGGHPIPLLHAMLPWPLDSHVIDQIPTAANAEEARARVREIHAKFEPQFIKIIYDDLPPGSPHLSSEALKGAIEQARELELRPIVHTNTREDTLEAAEGGAALLMHVPQRSALTDEDVARLQKAGVPFATTVRLLSASHDLAERGPSALEEASVDADHLARWRASPTWDLPGFSEEIDQMHAEVAEMTHENFRKLHAAGVPMFVGTDSGVHGVFPGSSIHRELQLLVSLGMSPIAALRAATSGPADFLDSARSFGRIAEGQRADLLVVRGDPTKDIAALEEISAVYLDGVRLSRRSLKPAD